MTESTISISVSTKYSSSQSLRVWLSVALLVAALLGVLFHEGIVRMMHDWFADEEYSHCVLLPFISGYLIWKTRDESLQYCGDGHWFGVIIVVASMLINIAGKYSSIFALQQYALIMALYGVVFSIGGARLFRRLLAPLLLLILVVPLPNFFLNTLSSQLQLVSSKLGVMFIRMTGISVFLEGNVIDLGTYKLQVVEACSGLRYLFPLITMAAVMAYLFQTRVWKKLLLVISAVPLTIIMNSLRIGSVGLMVDRWGPRMAEGFLHEFQGWMVFMTSLFALFGEVALIAWLEGKSWRTSFGFSQSHSPDHPDPTAQPMSLRWLSMSGVVMLLAVIPVLAMPKETEIIPQREFFSSYPLQLGQWTGKRQQLDSEYLDGLKLDDYLLADYSTVSSDPPVNMYVAWYNSQQAGHSVHSPKSCLPGNGWIIKTSETATLNDGGGNTWSANRVVMEYGAQRQLVYYWFQQRGRAMNNEYIVKWYLLLDSLIRQRSDGALVRFVAPVPDGESIEYADNRLQSFIRLAVPSLASYIPN